MSKLLKPILYISWTIGIYFLFRWMLYRYWAFDVLSIQAWEEMAYIWNAGKVFPWLFIFSFIFVIPVWIMGLMFIKKVDFVTIIKKVITYPIVANKRKRIQHLAKKSVKIKKNKSYIDTRPPPLKPVMGEAFTKNPRKHIEETDQRFLTQENNVEDDFYSSRESRRDRDFDDFNDDKRLPILGEPEDSALEFLDTSFEQKSIENRKQDGASSIPELLENAGYKVLEQVKVASDTIDFIAIANDGVILCFEENSPGDWLADEERFGGSDPLWFSETAQKVSPSSRALRVRDVVNREISLEFPEMTIVPVLIISGGSIMNASDMVDTWEEMQIFVGRFGAGGPPELKKLVNLIPQNPEDTVKEEIIEKITDIINSIK